MRLISDLCIGIFISIDNKLHVDLGDVELYAESSIYFQDFTLWPLLILFNR